MKKAKKTDARAVMFEGDLTLARAGEIKRALRSALEGGEVAVRFGETGAVDLSFLQLLCAARSSAAERGVRLTVEGEKVPRAVSELVRRAGFAPSSSAGEGESLWAVLADATAEGEADG